jgi:hypothetical protein
VALDEPAGPTISGKGQDYDRGHADREDDPGDEDEEIDGAHRALLRDRTPAAAWCRRRRVRL